MTEDEEIAFTEKYRARYDAAYARHGSALKTSKPAHFPMSIKDKNVFLGVVLPVPPPLKMPTVYSKEVASKSAETVTSPENHAAFIPMSLGDVTSADWHPVNDTGPQVTPEMLTAAKESMLDYGWMSPGDKALTIAYRAMRELEFSTTMVLAPDARMVEERDAARAELKTYKKFHDRWVAQYGPTMKALHDENLRLHDQLAKFTAANVPEPEPARHDPFRDFPNDPRRMGR